MIEALILAKVLMASSGRDSPGTNSARERKFPMFSSMGVTGHGDPRDGLLGITVFEHGVHGVSQITLCSHLA